MILGVFCRFCISLIIFAFVFSARSSFNLLTRSVKTYPFMCSFSCSNILPGIPCNVSSTSSLFSFVYLTYPHLGRLMPKNRNGKDRQPSFNTTDSGLTSLIIGLKTYRTLPSSICGCPPMTNIRYGKPT